MTTPVLLLRELSAKGVELDVRDGKLHYRIPRSLPAEEVLEQLRAVKDHLISLLGEAAYWQRAPRERWCGACQEAAERGETVLLCSLCDEPRKAS